MNLITTNDLPPMPKRCDLIFGISLEALAELTKDRSPFLGGHAVRAEGNGIPVVIGGTYPIILWESARTECPPLLLNAEQHYKGIPVIVNHNYPITLDDRTVIHGCMIGAGGQKVFLVDRSNTTP